MLLENPASLEGQALDPDRVVVVGAGAVGVHLAVQLARRGRQVVLLEAGDHALDSYPDETFEVVGRAHEGVRIGRSVALGGTTNLWGGQLVEFMPIDFDGRDWLPGSRWPIRYDEVTPYYPPTYEAMGIEPGVQRDAPVWDTLRKTPPELGEGVEVFLTRWMRVPNVASHFREEVEKNPKLIVVMGAKAVGFEGEATAVTAVRVAGVDGAEHTVRGGRFVLAAGTIENARLLLHTADDASWPCPWAGNDNVGRWFQDHLGGRLAYIKPRNAKAFYDLFCTVVLRGDKFQPKVRLRNAVLEEEPLVSCQAMISFESSISENLVFLKQFVKAALFSRKIGSVVDFFRNAWACSRHMIPLMWKFVVEHRILIPSGSRISLTLQSEVEPLRESRITIDRSVRDRFGLPKVVLDWRLSGRELEGIRDFTHRVERALADAGLADLEIEPDLAANRPEFLDSLHDTNHHAGGCVMGDSADDGVVDRDLRVFGTDNLYVTGASVFRTSSNANTTFTAMTLTTRLAEHLAEAPVAAG